MLRPAIAAATLAAALSACSLDHRTRTITREGVELRRVGVERTTAGFAALAEGDFVLTARGLRVAIAGAVRNPRDRMRPGAVLHVALDGHGGTAPQAVVPFLRADGRDVALTGEHFETLLVDGRPTLRLTAAARTASGAVLRVVRDYALDPALPALVVATRVEHASGPVARDVTVGAILPWRAQAPFAPGLGLVSAAATARAPWLGRAAGGVAFAWAAPAGDLALRFEPDLHAGRAITGETEAVSLARDLGPRQHLATHSHLVAVVGDLADAARVVARARSERVVETPVRVLGASTADERFVLVTRPDRTVALTAAVRGEAPRALPLAPGEYVAYAFAPGHSTSDPVRFAARGGGGPVDLELPEGGRIRFAVTDEATGRELPVRVVVRGISGTPDPALGPEHEAAGAGFIAIAASGRGEVTVPAGRYALAFSHGPEWSVAHAVADVTATMRGDVTARLRRAVPMDDWTACDLHVHARPSFDSQVSVEDRVASLVAEGIEFATPSEHNVVGDYGPGVAALPPAASREGGGSGLGWVPAVEVTTDRARQPVGHFNVYPFAPTRGATDGAPPPFLEAPHQIFRAVRARNPDAIIQVNHPRMEPGIGYFDLVQLDPTTNVARSPLYDPGYDAVEVFNGFFLGRIDTVDAVMRDWFALLGTGARYVGTASSDSHAIAYHQAGYPRTYVYTPGAGDRAPEPDAVVRALRAGRAFGTSGPMLFVRAGDALPGDTVRTAARELAVRVTVMAAPWVDVDSVEVYRDGVRVATLPVPASEDALRLERDVVVPLVGPRSYVVVVARGDRALDVVLPNVDARPFAFTNPIWIERDRQHARR